MTLVPVEVEEVASLYNMFTWTGMVPGDEGEAVEIYKFGDRTIQCVGSTNKLTLQGNNLPDILPWYVIASGATLSWNMLNPGKPTFNGNPFYFNPRWVRPIMLNSVGATDVPVTVSLFCLLKG